MNSLELDLSRIRAIAFDFHGTLANTSLAHHAARIQAFAAHGFGDIPAAMHAGGQEIAATAPAVIGRILKQAKKIPDLDNIDHNQIVRQVVATHDDAYRILTSRGLDARHEAVDLARELAPRLAGRVAIVTGAPREEVAAFSRKNRLDDIFPEEFRITRESLLDEGLGLKPEQDGYLLAMRRMDVYEPRMLVFESSDNGLAAALASGATVCAVRNDFEEPSRLESEADHTVASLADVKIL